MHSETRLNVTEVDPCIRWFQGMQKFVASKGDLRITVQWLEKLHRTSPASVIARFDNVRKLFLQALKRNGNIFSIEAFIETHAYIQLQVKYDNSLYRSTKPDGLCCLRSLKQLRDAASIRFQMIGKKNRNQSDDWGELDVKLEIEDSRNDFKTFLTDLIRALKLMTLERCSEKGGGFRDEGNYSDLANNWITKLELTLDRIENFKGDWENFVLEQAH